MKIAPIAGPLPVQASSIQTTSAADARARAIAALQGNAPTTGQQQAEAVKNPSQVSVEELSAVKAPETRQSDTTETVETQEVTSSETPAEPEKPKVDPALSRQFAQLARQEQALRAKAQKQEQAMKAREEAIAAREAALQPKAEAPSAPRSIDMERLRADPLSVLAEAGLSYEELTQQIINQQPRDPRVSAEMEALRAEIKALKAETEKTSKTYTEQQQASYNAAVAQIRSDAERLVNSDPEFETIKATKSVNDVVDLITKTYEQDGVLMTVEEAAKEVEDYLLEEAVKLTTIQKIQKRLQAGQPKTQVEQPKPVAEPKPAQSQPTKTLTNAIASSRQLSARERAVLAFKGELKS